MPVDSGTRHEGSIDRGPDDQDAVERAPIKQAAAIESLFATIETDHDCRMTMHGRPQPDASSSQWFVRYAASGRGCDSAVDALRALGRQTDVLFFRKPDLDQVHALLATMTRSVRSIFGCQVAITGEPRVVEATGRWLVSYVGVGGNCSAAAEELARRGAELEITFVRRPHPGQPDSLLDQPF